MSSYLINFISLLFRVLSFAILGRVLLSWVGAIGDENFGSGGTEA